MKTIIVLSLFIGTYFSLKFLQLALKGLSKKYNLLKNLNRLFPIIVSIIWIVLIFWSAHFLFKLKSYYDIVVISIVIIISAFTGWFFIKDFIAGIVFRLQNDYTEGDILHFNDTGGIISSLSLTHVMIISNDDQMLSIPYSRISNEITIQNAKITALDNNTSLIITDKKNDVKTTLNNIYKEITTSPWRIPNKKPAVRFIGEDNSNYKFEIKVEVRNKKHLNNIIEQVEQKFSHSSDRL